MFPGYVLVKLAVFYDEESGTSEMSDEAWYVIRNTRGVTGFVGPGSKPVPLTQAEVAALGVEKQQIEVNYCYHNRRSFRWIFRNGSGN